VLAVTDRAGVVGIDILVGGKGGKAAFALAVSP